MSIDKGLLYKYLREFILARYHEPDQLLILELVEKVVFNDPEQNCHIKGRRSDWDGLPPSKSLFTSGKGKGLPIGNLTSQIFANFYLNFFDHYVKYDLGIEYYGRYVDDFVIVHEDKDFLIDVQAKLRSFLQAKLMLRLHPRKIYLQHFQRASSLSVRWSSPAANISATAPKETCMPKFIITTKRRKKSAQGQKTAARPAGQRQFVSGVYDSLQNVQNPPPFA